MEKVTTTVTLDPYVKRRAKEILKEDGMTLSYYIRLILKDLVKTDDSRRERRFEK